MPEEFAQREDTSIRPVKKQKKPVAIIVTVLIAALITIFSGLGFIRLHLSIRTLQDRSLMFHATGFATGQLIAVVFAAASAGLLSGLPVAVGEASKLWRHTDD